jgi:glycosyltransferase involved in cell wall biosynthesis
LLQKLLEKHRISLLSHSQALVAGPTVGWIADFQHVHLPEFFSQEERLYRDRTFLALCGKCEQMIVSSECAKADLSSFAPQYAHKARVLRFVATPQVVPNLPTLPELQQRYSFDEPFFLLPNQFWAHKNHRVVISALKLVKERGKRALVLATGLADDSRNPGFFDSLMQYARECDVLDEFRTLGVIPFQDLAGLMQFAVAFINPSYFEGWSTTVEEAKSMGKGVLLSDIPVHREQSPELGVYFHPDDPEALAAALLDASSGHDARSDADLQARARQGLPARQERFAATYQSIVLEAAQTSRQSSVSAG